MVAETTRDFFTKGLEHIPVDIPTSSREAQSSQIGKSRVPRNLLGPALVLGAVTLTAAVGLVAQYDLGLRSELTKAKDTLSIRLEHCIKYSERDDLVRGFQKKYPTSRSLVENYELAQTDIGDLYDICPGKGIPEIADDINGLGMKFYDEADTFFPKVIYEHI